MIRPPAWTDPKIVNAAVDLTTDVRDLDPEMIRREIARIPPDTLAGLAVVLAAMVDVDQPMTALTAWADLAPASVPKCQRGHPLLASNVMPNGGGRWRCRTCLTEQRRRPA